MILFKKYRALIIKIIIVAAILIAFTIAGAIYISPSRPLPFSKFLTEDWKRGTAALREQGLLNILQTNFYDGGAGVDTYEVIGGGTTVIDSILAVHFEVYNLKNKSPNIIVILMPGLADIDNNILTVKADAGLDKVYIDGCLDWRAGKTEGEYNAIQIKDPHEEIRTIMLSKKVEVYREKECNNKYLGRYKKMIDEFNNRKSKVSM
ncbi:MAG: hypothetical protein A3J37_00845 [Alphaproteobacteria bacterium RIFCSPHIGHO2_12_FULL_45_9]|nr:MAG: hypothetical protein A3B66_03640 [Alphaproteobacteria bacterium RIFCSPHIGHO2_02_FULL_46_13]OFW97039.1 MAG: hypothetical protein A3J37_00845 [Alphaproteobacteria bacterium RIFCSPHIGHO2_12_FULL_45_9]